jgi:hypothetical protein
MVFFFYLYFFSAWGIDPTRRVSQTHFLQYSSLALLFFLGLEVRGGWFSHSRIESNSFFTGFLYWRGIFFLIVAWLYFNLCILLLGQNIIHTDLCWNCHKKVIQSSGFNTEKGERHPPKNSFRQKKKSEAVFFLIESSIIYSSTYMPRKKILVEYLATWLVCSKSNRTVLP